MPTALTRPLHASWWHTGPTWCRFHRGSPGHFPAVSWPSELGADSHVGGWPGPCSPPARRTQLDGPPLVRAWLASTTAQRQLGPSRWSWGHMAPSTPRTAAPASVRAVCWVFMGCHSLGNDCTGMCLWPVCVSRLRGQQVDDSQRVHTDTSWWGHTSTVPPEDRRWARCPMGWAPGWGHLGFKMQTQLMLAEGRE